MLGPRLSLHLVIHTEPRSDPTGGPCYWPQFSKEERNPEKGKKVAQIHPAFSMEAEICTHICYSQSPRETELGDGQTLSGEGRALRGPSKGSSEPGPSHGLRPGTVGDAKSGNGAGVKVRFAQTSQEESCPAGGPWPPFQMFLLSGALPGSPCLKWPAIFYLLLWVQPVPYLSPSDPVCDSGLSSSALLGRELAIAPSFLPSKALAQGRDQGWGQVDRAWMGGDRGQEGWGGGEVRACGPLAP